MFYEFGDWVVAISVFLVALLNIYNFFAKPTSFFKKKLIDQEATRTKQILNETLPKIFEQHDLETRAKYLGDRQAYLEEIKQEVVQQISDEFGDTIKEIKQINESQNAMIETLARSSKDILREKIMALYHKGRKTKTLYLYQWEALQQYYIDYKAEGGNSYIDKYYNRMRSWTITDSDVEAEE